MDGTFTWHDLFSVARDVVMAAAWAIVWVVRRESKRINERFAAQQAELERIHHDLYESGGRVSEIDHRLRDLRTVLSLKDIVAPDEQAPPPVIRRRPRA